MLGIQLRPERSRLVPVIAVLDAHSAFAGDSPGLLVEARDRRHGTLRGRGRRSVSVSFTRSGLHAKVDHVISKIANLIKGVPRGHLDHDRAVNVWDGHGDVKRVRGRVRDRDFVANGGTRGCDGQQEGDAQNGDRDREKRRPWCTAWYTHEALARLRSSPRLLASRSV